MVDNKCKPCSEGAIVDKNGNCKMCSAGQEFDINGKCACKKGTAWKKNGVTGKMSCLNELKGGGEYRLYNINKKWWHKQNKNGWGVPAKNGKEGNLV